MLNARRKLEMLQYETVPSPSSYSSNARGVSTYFKHGYCLLPVNSNLETVDAYYFYSKRERHWFVKMKKVGLRKLKKSYDASRILSAIST